MDRCVSKDVDHNVKQSVFFHINTMKATVQGFSDGLLFSSVAFRFAALPF